MSEIATTPKPPYYAVIFSSVRTADNDGYEQTAERMFALAEQQSGCLGVEIASGGLGITISYWQDLASIARWKQQAEHLLAQQRGREQWYAQYMTRVCKVERDYQFDAKQTQNPPTDH